MAARWWLRNADSVARRARTTTNKTRTARPHPQLWAPTVLLLLAFFGVATAAAAAAAAAGVAAAAAATDAVAAALLLLCRQACDRNYGAACFNVAFMYKRGDGVKQDDEKAEHYYQVCGSQARARTHARTRAERVPVCSGKRGCAGVSRVLLSKTPPAAQVWHAKVANTVSLPVRMSWTAIR